MHILMRQVRLFFPKLVLVSVDESNYCYIGTGFSTRYIAFCFPSVALSADKFVHINKYMGKNGVLFD